jgi:transposase-like protein
MARVVRQYTEADKAEILALLDTHGGNLSATSRDTGIAISTIQSWRDGVGVNASVTNARNGIKESLDSLCERVAYKMLGIALDKADSMGGYQAMVSAGIAVDKMRLLREQATVIAGGLPASREERLERAAELLTKHGLRIDSDDTRAA